jgi:hypothetical protein
MWGVCCARGGRLEPDANHVIRSRERAARPARSYGEGEDFRSSTDGRPRRHFKILQERSRSAVLVKLIAVFTQSSLSFFLSFFL